MYDQGAVDKYQGRLSTELSFFKDQKIIFLGKYDVYDKLISRLKLNAIKIRHPSYYSHRGFKGLEIEKSAVKEFVKNL
jgi:hypothetical protein